MADDVEALIDALELENAVVIGWSFGSFVAQSHMVRHGSASAYVLMGTVSQPGALADVEHELATFEPESLRAQVAASWALEASVETPEQAKQLLADQMPFHVADPDGSARRPADRSRSGRLPAGRAAALRRAAGTTACSTFATSCEGS